MNIDNPTSLLAIEEKPNSFLPINLEELGFIVSSEILTLKDLDYFVLNVGEENLKDIIKRANVVPEDALNGDLVILYDNNKQKKKLPILKKEYLEKYDLQSIISDYIDNKQFINRVISKIKTLNISEEIKQNIEVALKEGNTNLFLIAYNSLTYLLQRNLYLYMINGIIKMEANAKRVRGKDEE